MTGSVNIAFTAGIVSTVMLLDALQKGLKVNLQIVNTNSYTDLAFTVAQTFKIIDAVKAIGYKKGIIDGVTIHVKPCYRPRSERPRWYADGRPPAGLINNSITNKFAVVLGMMDMRRYSLDDAFPGVWMGWTHQTTSEYTGNELDMSEEGYEDLRLLPRIMGPVSGSDATGTPYRTPLWEMTRDQMMEIITQHGLERLVLHDGAAKVMWAHDKFVWNVHESKVEQWRLFDCYHEMPGEHWEFKLSELPVKYRMLCGAVRGADFDLPPEADEFVLRFADTFVSKMLILKDTDLDHVAKNLREEIHTLLEFSKRFDYQIEQPKGDGDPVVVAADGSGQTLREFVGKDAPINERELEQAGALVEHTGKVIQLHTGKPID